MAMHLHACSSIFVAPPSSVAFGSFDELGSSSPAANHNSQLAPLSQLDRIKYISSVTSMGANHPNKVVMSVNYGDCMQFHCKVARRDLGLPQRAHRAIDKLPPIYATQ